MNHLDSRITMHSEFEPWMLEWIFEEGDEVLGYAPDNTVIVRGSLEDLDLFFTEFELAGNQWMNNHEQ